MVDVAGQFCIDRYEGVLIDARSGRRLSPFYYPSAAQARASLRAWQAQSTRIGPASARLMPVPLPPEWELSESFEPESRTLADEIPNGYLSADLAAEACARSGKRLCSEAEWVMACKGERQTKYPYGDRYQEGACNVFRAVHPAQLLHSDASAGHLDPRLNLVTENGAPLLQRTGSSPSCASHWGTDAAYDMVGNLDEWVDDPYGRFLGGFYSRNTREGCDARVSAHPRNYFDYSLGVRCCR